ncbi:MAG: hypothetical protein ABJC89_07980 [Acidobacteriota bacterium]
MPESVDHLEPVGPARWTFITPTPVGDERATYHLTAATLEFDSDALVDGGHVSVPWATIVEAGTAGLEMPVGRGAPDLGRFVPGQLEWLIASRADAPGKPFMRPLPPAPERDALIATVREHVGARWAGERIPLLEARQRFGIPSGGENLEAAAIVAGVLALLALLLILLLLAVKFFLLPAGFALGIWLCRKGLAGRRDAFTAANTPTARVSSATNGLIEIEGLARTGQPSPAAVSGRPSVWWDVTVEAWSKQSDSGGTWRQLAARHGGTMDCMEVEDPTGRLYVWLKDANLLAHEESWEAGRDTLPPSGAELMAQLGFSFGPHVRVREARMEVGAPVYVLGTLDRRRTIPDLGTEGMAARILTQIRTGQWQTTLVRNLPRPVGMLVAGLFGFLGIVLGVGRGGERVKGPQDSAPPDIPLDALVVWKGRTGRPFIVSNGREAQALAQLRSRSLYQCAGGIAVLGYCAYELIWLLWRT